MSNEWISVPYTVNGSTYYADINIVDLQDTIEEDGVEAGREYIDYSIQEAFNNNIYPCYSLDKIAQKINQQYGTNVEL